MSLKVIPTGWQKQKMLPVPKLYFLVIMFPKLVRDHIPDIIRSEWRTPLTHTASEEEYEYALQQKLREEVEEFLKDPTAEEAWDIVEVLHAFARSKKFDIHDIETFQRKKYRERWGFDMQIILDWIAP